MNKVFLFLFVALLLSSTATALDITKINNVKIYDDTSKTATIKESALGKAIVNATLNTPQIYNVGYGAVFKVAEFTIVNVYGEDYANVLDDMKIINLNNNREESKLITYKYKTYGIRTLNITEKSECKIEDKWKNGTTVDNCKTTYKTQNETYEIWENLDDFDILNGQSITIGLFTYVNKGDKYEWIPQIAGRTVEEWAVWSSGLNANLMGYYTLNNNSVDSLARYNGTDTNVAYVSAKQDYGANFSNNGMIDMGDVYDINTSNFTASFWFRWASSGAYDYVISKSSAGGSSDWEFRINNANKLEWSIYGGTGVPSAVSTSNMNTGQWIHVVGTRNTANGTDILKLYLNGVLNSTSIAGSLHNPDGADPFRIGRDGTTNSFYYMGTIDEVALWNRVLTEQEISDLYNNGQGISYTFASPPTIYLLSPANATTTYTPTNNYVCNVTSTDGIRNVSLVWNGNVVYTNTSQVNNTNYTLPYTLTTGAGTYNWTCQAFTLQNVSATNSSIRTITYANSLTATSQSPATGYYTSTSPVTIIGYASDDTAVLNVSLLWNGVREQTNSTGINNTNYTFTKSISVDGTYNWGIEACDANACAITANRTITYDTTSPQISITSPTNTDYALHPTTALVNYTITEASQQFCWYDYNSTYTDFANRTLLADGWFNGDYNDTLVTLAVGNYTYAIRSDKKWMTISDRLDNINGTLQYTKYYLNLSKCTATAGYYNMSLEVLSTGGSGKSNNFTCNSIGLQNINTQGLGSQRYITEIDTIREYVNCSTASDRTNLNPFVSQLTFYANDSAGLQNSTNYSWTYKVVEFNNTYNATANEVSSEVIRAFVVLSPSVSIDQALLYYDGSAQNITESTSNGITTLTSSFVTPSVTATQNKTFNFELTLNDTTIVNLASYNQTVYNLVPLTAGQTCSAGLNQTMVFYVTEEQNRTNSTADSISYNFKYGTNINNTFNELYGTINGGNITQFVVCINLTATPSYIVGYGEIQYEKSGSTARRHYSFTNITLDSNTRYDELPLLPNADATSFLFTFKDTSLTSYVGAYSALLRWYPSINSYDTVEMAKTDDKGQTIMRVEVEDVDYRVALYETDGTLIRLLSPVRFACLSSPCSYNVFVDPSETDYTSDQNIDGEITFNETTNIWSYTFSDASQNTDSMRLLVRRETGSSYYTICNTTATGYTGVLTCNSTGFAGKMRGLAFRTASPEKVIADKTVDTTSGGLEGVLGILLGVVATLALALIGIYSPPATIILGLLGVFLAYVVGAVPVVMFIALGVVGGIVIHFLKRTGG